MSDNSNDLGAFLAGFVIGGLVGAATAIILAPQSGEETRSQIANKSNEFIQSGSARMQQVRDTAGTYSQDYLDKAGSALSSTRQQVMDVGGRVQEQARIVLDKGKEQASQLTNRGDKTDANGSDV
ncbi:MAG: YtxH domain-containing protein [Ardenticatenaceae bacterium]|nr:YtxH domain-containing protein [Anaerolineales bacterium]MCB8940927.1 YtxH domain-containing protein [Ardenticatenaceae bacterium]MCB8972266.1 YtxH domain-containing protein [Ardenticatenaceae bacterium]